MSAPHSVSVDGSGRLWVADANNHRVLRFDAAASLPNGAAADGVLGQPDFASRTATTTAEGMKRPTNIAADGSGWLWVTDTDNHRALLFELSLPPALHPRVYIPLVRR